MTRTRTLIATAAVTVGSSSALVFGGAAAADPVVPPPPVPNTQLPGMPAMEQFSPAIQQAAADPSSAASLLMAAAAAFAGNSTAPADSREVADSVSHFVQNPAQPVAHTPAERTMPDAVVHLPTGVDPANAVGPLPAPGPAPQAAAAPAPDATPAPEAAPAPAGLPSPSDFDPSSPPTQDFMYPSIGNGCLADGGNAIATALSVAGPATIPTPGPAAGQTAYVFTAVGTSGPAEVQKLPLNVTWVNLTTGESGSATLKPHPEINPNGPTTLTAIVDTGSGSIMSTIFGQVSTRDKQCNFMPTIGSTVVP